jgi:HD-like signal output (HDOD) protein
MQDSRRSLVERISFVDRAGSPRLRQAHGPSPSTSKLRFRSASPIVLVANNMNSATPTLGKESFTPEQIVQAVNHLPSSPKVLPRLKKLLQDGNSSMEEIALLVRLDAAIAARVLRAGNSAYYNQGLHCETVDEAVNRVGFDHIYQLVSYAVASQVLVRPLNVYGLDADEIWRQSVACALAAERIALITGEDGNVAYTVGLLHRIGMVAINEWALRKRLPLRLVGDEFPGEYVRSERATLGCTQADVGAELLGRWDFPREMTIPVKHQYAPRGTVGGIRMTSLLYAARWVRATVCEEPGRSTAPDASLLQVLQLSEAQLNAVAKDVRAHLDTISTLLVETESKPMREFLGPGARVEQVRQPKSGSRFSTADPKGPYDNSGDRGLGPLLAEEAESDPAPRRFAALRED